jgi:hypothetical protein
VNNSAITCFSKSDTGSNFVVTPMYFQSLNIPFNKKPMWIIKSLITNAISYDPLIVMGTFTNYYYVMILQGGNGLILEAAEFYSPEVDMVDIK